MTPSSPTSSSPYAAAPTLREVLAADARTVVDLTLLERLLADLEQL